MGKSVGPCVALQSLRCQKTPNAHDPTNQYKNVPDKYRLENDLPEGSCVCRSPVCWQFVGLIPKKKGVGRPPKRPRDDVPVVPGQVVAGVRLRPQIVEQIIQIKAPR